MAGNSRFGSLGRSGVLGLVFVGVIVVALFFIPEVIQVQQSLKKGDNAATTSEIKDTSSGPSLIDRAKTFLASLSASRPKAGRSASEQNAINMEESPRGSLGEVSRSVQNLGSGGPTWEQLKATDSRNAIFQARKTSLELARSIPQDKANSRFALINFANGLDYVLNKGPEQMSPREAINYLTRLDSSVARAFVQDNLERIYVKRWSQVSMGPVLGHTMLGRGHDQFVTQFNPQVTLTWVRVLQYSDRNRVPNSGKVLVGISGYMIGDDVKKAELVGDGGAVISPLHLNRDPRGYWFFNRKSLDGRKIWTVRVYDKFGETHDKTYQFFPAVQKFHYLNRTEGYQMPFQMSVARVGLFKPSEFDQRLDAYFRRSPGFTESDDESTLFTRF